MIVKKSNKKEKNGIQDDEEEIDSGTIVYHNKDIDSGTTKINDTEDHK